LVALPNHRYVFRLHPAGKASRRLLSLTPAFMRGLAKIAAKTAWARAERELLV
jgi:hypothetical protein